MDIREKLKQELKKAEALKARYDNIEGGTAGSIIIGRTIAQAQRAINTGSKLFMAESLKELQALE